MSDDINRLLNRWADCVLSETVLPTGLGYPSSSPGAEGSGSPPRRDKAEQRHADAMRRLAQRVSRRWQANPKQTRCRKPQAPKYEPWPAEVRDVHAAVSLLPDDYQTLILERYLLRYSRRESCKQHDITEWQYHQSMAGAQGAIRTMLRWAA